MIIYQYHSDQLDNPNQAEVEGHNVDPDEVLQGGLGVPGDYGLEDMIIVMRNVLGMAQTCWGLWS